MKYELYRINPTPNGIYIHYYHTTAKTYSVYGWFSSVHVAKARIASDIIFDDTDFFSSVEEIFDVVDTLDSTKYLVAEFTDNNTLNRITTLWHLLRSLS